MSAPAVKRLAATAERAHDGAPVVMRLAGRRGACR